MPKQNAGKEACDMKDNRQNNQTERGERGAQEQGKQ